MAQEVINIGALADDGTGDTIRGSGIKINNNFTELYATPFAQTSIGFVENIAKKSIFFFNNGGGY